MNAKITLEEAEALSDTDLMTMDGVELEAGAEAEAALHGSYDAWVATLEEDVREAMGEVRGMDLFAVYATLRVNDAPYAVSPAPKP